MFCSVKDYFVYLGDRISGTPVSERGILDIDLTFYSASYIILDEFQVVLGLENKGRPLKIR